MSLFSAFQSLWSYCCDNGSSCDSSITSDPVGPVVNIDGTPMLNETVDIHGHPYGVTETALFDWHATQDSSSMDCSHDFGGSCGMDSGQW